MTGKAIHLYRYFFFHLLGLIFTTTAYAQTTKQIERLLTRSPICNTHFTGFVLYDADKDKIIYSQHDDLHFSPASNTKLFTLYTALEMLGDSIPTIKYQIKGDSLIFWGTGDPTLFRKDFDSSKLYTFLKNAPQKLYYAYNNYKGDFYGRGWPYGDYNAYYQAEINALPIAGNLVNFSRDSLNGMLSIYPSYFHRSIHYNYDTSTARFAVKRLLYDNNFTIPNLPIPMEFERQIPYKTSPELTKQLLEDTLKRTVNLVDLPMPEEAIALYSSEADTVYRALMLPSDNFIAEQLLLVCSTLLGNELSTSATIDHSLATILADLPDQGKWVDGSGLSKMNLFTPSTIVALLKKLKEKVGDDERLYSLLPAGGKSGTLKNAYQLDRGEVFVWGKTGTLSGAHNQSGYLTTRKGKQLIFSFMNNNFVRPTAEVRAEMVRIMTEIREKY